MSFLSDIFDPGRKDRKKAARFAKQGVISGGGFTGPGGLAGGFDFTKGRTSVNSDLGSFAPFLEMLQQNASQQLGQSAGGLPPELLQSGADTVNRLGNFNIGQLTNTSDFNKLGELFQSNAAFAQRDVFDVGDEISQRLRALSERSNQRLVNKTFDRLKASGMLGTSGGAGIAGELDANLFDQGLKFDLAGLDFGSQQLNDAFGRALASSQQRESIGARTFGENFATEQLGGERALQQFGVNQQLFQDLMAQQAQGSQLGMGYLTGAMGLTQLPLQFLSALQNLGTSASNTNFAAAGVNQQNAAMAKSPFLEALNAAGSFMTGIAPGGFFGNPVGQG